MFLIIWIAQIPADQCHAFVIIKINFHYCSFMIILTQTLKAAKSKTNTHKDRFKCTRTGKGAVVLVLPLKNIFFFFLSSGNLVGDK